MCFDNFKEQHFQGRVPLLKANRGCLRSHEKVLHMVPRRAGVRTGKERTKQQNLYASPLNGSKRQEWTGQDEVRVSAFPLVQPAQPLVVGSSNLSFHF